MQLHYRTPDFDRPELQGVPPARFVPAPADGLLPEGAADGQRTPA